MLNWKCNRIASCNFPVRSQDREHNTCLETVIYLLLTPKSTSPALIPYSELSTPVAFFISAWMSLVFPQVSLTQPVQNWITSHHPHPQNYFPIFQYPLRFKPELENIPDLFLPSRFLLIHLISGQSYEFYLAQFIRHLRPYKVNTCCLRSGSLEGESKRGSGVYMISWGNEF